MKESQIPFLIAATRPAVLNYQYGCRIDHDTEEHAIAQFRLAHILYNDLIAAIRTISEGARARIMAEAPDSAREMQLEIDRLTEAFRLAKAADEETLMKSIAGERRAAWAKLRPLLKTTRAALKSTLATEFYSRIGKNVGTDTYAIKVVAVAFSGLGGDTASDVLDSALQAYKKSMATGGMPHFRRAFEITSETLTIAAHTGGGLDSAKFTNGEYKPVSITLRGEQVRRKYHGFEFRAGAASDKKFITGTVEMHRPLPKDSGVAEVRLKRCRVGNSYRWYLQFSVVMNYDNVAPIPLKQSLCAVHFGWAKRDDGREVCAIASGVDDVSMLHFPQGIERTLDNVERKQSERDAYFNVSVAAIKDVLRGFVVPDEKLEERVAAMLQTAPTYIAPSKLHALIASLRRFDITNDSLDAWAKKDAEMWLSIGSGQRRAVMQRRYFYRGIAAKLAATYQSVVITDLDLADAAKKIDEVTGEKTEFTKAARSGRVRAAVSELKSCITQAFAREGGVVMGSDANVAQVCSDCGETSLVDSETDHLVQSCSSCGARHARKVNAARNLYALVSGDDVDRVQLEAEEKYAAGVMAKLERLKKMQAAKAAKRAQSMVCE